MAPYLSRACPSYAVSFWVWAHVVPVRLNTYAAPRSLLFHIWSGAPTNAMSPRTAKLLPNLSNLPPSDAVSFWLCFQVVPERESTYTAPESWARSSSFGAPVMAQSPLTDTEVPTKSLFAPSAATNLCAWLLLLLRQSWWKWAEPELPPLSSSWGTPSRARLPLSATAWPKLSPAQASLAVILRC